MKNFFGIHAKINKWVGIFLGVPVFAILALVYSNTPDTKIFPTVDQMGATVAEYATEAESRRKETPPLVADTAISLQRLGIGVGLAALVALFLGLNMGMFKWFDHLMYPFINIASSIPPVAIMPILLIAFGKDELGKVMMIFFGLVFGLVQAVRAATKDIPHEQLIKAETLGASTLGIVYRCVLPQVFPRMIDAVRVNIGLAWIFTIVAEFISSSQGLGYRIFLVRRYLDMSAILPYVVWITILGFCMMSLLMLINRKVFPWYVK